MAPARELRGLSVIVATALLPMSSAMLRRAPFTAPYSHVQRMKAPLAQDGWTTATDQASGQTYYYNQQTGQSQWEPPQAFTQHSHGGQPTWHHPHGTNQVLWRLVGSSGTHSRYNLRKHDVQVLSRYNMLKQSLFVSRKQCMISCLADGTTTLTSVGKAPTLWRDCSGPWCSVQRGESLRLTHGDQVSLDCKDPDNTVFTCQEKSVMQQGTPLLGGLAAEGHGEPQLASPWEQVADQNGAVYYINPQTGEAQWDPPQQASHSQRLDYPHEGNYPHHVNFPPQGGY